MKITIQGVDYDLQPWEFKNNALFSSVDFGYQYTTFLNQGDMLDLTPIFKSTYYNHKNDATDWVGDTEYIAHIKYTANGDIEVDTNIEGTPSHRAGDIFITYTVVNPYTNQTAIFYVMYEIPLEKSMNKLCMFYIEQSNATTYGNPIGICNPSYPDGNGGFYHRWYNDTLINPQVVIDHCDFVDLDRFIGPNPNLPNDYNPKCDELAVFANCTPKIDTDVLWNDETYQLLNPDDDINTPDTEMGPYHDISDIINIDDLPSVGPLDTGFIKAYVVTTSQCQSIATFMLSDSFITNVKKLFATPIDYIISLHFLPISPTVTTATDVIIGGVDTQVDAPQTFDNYIDFSCGAVNLEEFWGSFIDYDCTKVSIYLPFIGIRELNTDDVMTGVLQVNYRVNVLDGDFVVSIHSNTSHKLNGIIAQFQGNMMLQTPVTSLDYSNKVNAAFTALSSLPGIAMGNAGSMVQGAAGMLEATLSKPMIQRSGNISGGAGMLGNFTPYLIKTRPKQAVPSLFTKLFGKPSMIGGKLDDFTGYTKIAKVNLSGVACTDAERDEILQLLEEGVFV